LFVVLEGFQGKQIRKVEKLLITFNLELFNQQPTTNN